MCVFSPEVGLGQGGSRQGRTQGAQWEQAASSGTQAGRFDKQEDLGGLRCGRGRQALNHLGLGARARPLSSRVEECPGLKVLERYTWGQWGMGGCRGRVRGGVSAG